MPAWTPLFGTAAAVVTETGGALSHCAIVAREYGIPAVVGVYGATRTIQTGQTISVDGTSGLITIETE
jgi:pyruvate,water dikinase